MFVCVVFCEVNNGVKFKVVDSGLLDLAVSEVSSSDSSSERSLAASRGRYSVSIRAAWPSLSARDVGVDSSGRQPKRSRR